MEILGRTPKKTEKKETAIKKLNYKSFIALLLPVVIITGLFFPLVGLFAFVCMAGAVILSIYKGRYWCYSFCPRGVFLDEFISKFSFKRPVPQILKSNFSKVFWVVFFMFMMVLNAAKSKGNLYEFGKGIVLLLWFTTLLAMAGGILFKARTWCIVCPMGTMSGLVGKKRKPLRLNTDECIECRLCSKKCPMEIEVCSFRENGAVESVNCIRCETCINVCPKNALQKS